MLENQLVPIRIFFYIFAKKTIEIRVTKKNRDSLSYKAWKRFCKNKMAVASLFFIGFSIVISALGYIITPDKTPYANNQHLELSAKKPGFNVDCLKIRKNIDVEQANVFNKMIWGEQSIYEYIPINKYILKRDSIVVELFTGIEAEEGMSKSYNIVDVAYAIHSSMDIETKENSYTFQDIAGSEISISEKRLKNIIVEDHLINKTFLLGTDRYGRDLLSQLMIGTRVSLSVGFIAVIISLIVGLLIGALGGYFGGKVDDAIVWFINVVWSIPTLLLVIAITFALGKGFWQVFIAVGLTMWVEVARVVRGQIISVREKEFVEAAKAFGYSNFRIVTKHIVPNILGPVIVIAAANFATAILIEAGLSFLGIGVQPPMPSWGTMIKEHYAYIVLDKAYLAIIPGVAIMLMVLSFMLIGNGLRDALDTKTV